MMVKCAMKKSESGEGARKWQRGGREDGVLFYVGWPGKVSSVISRSEPCGWINGPEWSTLGSSNSK